MSLYTYITVVESIQQNRRHFVVLISAKSSMLLLTSSSSRSRKHPFPASHRHICILFSLHYISDRQLCSVTTQKCGVLQIFTNTTLLLTQLYIIKILLSFQQVSFLYLDAMQYYNSMLVPINKFIPVFLWRNPLHTTVWRRCLLYKWPGDFSC